MDRLAMLSELLGQDPNNAFARYGLAMEYSNSGQLEQALDEFHRLLSTNPDYTAGYFMAAQTLMKCERPEEARKMLQDGIATAQRKGDAHAQSEMQSMLDEIG
jgi:predicted Zn-dependent protease